MSRHRNLASKRKLHTKENPQAKVPSSSEIQVFGNLDKAVDKILKDDREGYKRLSPRAKMRKRHNGDM